MKKTLRPYQKKSIDRIIKHYANGVNSVVFQLATGSGKTITSCALINRYIQKNTKNVLFLVHREELLTQFRRTMLEQHDIEPQAIMAGARYRNPKFQIYVSMVETANNRLKKTPKWFGDVGMLIVDECHIGSFNKVLQYFPNAFIVGLTATPLTASRKRPLKSMYQEIVCGIDTPELIKAGALMPNITYHIKNDIRRESFKIKNGEFDTTAMFMEYSKGKHIENCVKAYEEKVLGKKTLVFNCNVRHSEMVNDAFLSKGYRSKHLDGTTDKAERAKILKWFKDTPNAILQNIGVLTAGFDEPSVECIIMNRSTMSLPLWLQCTGRGSRPSFLKESFTIIDLGSNAITHGDWSDARDWAQLFHNPPKPGDKKTGLAPVKFCVECDAIIAVSANVCEFCGAEQPKKKVNYDKDDVALVMLNNSLHLAETNEKVKQNGSNPYSTLHIIKGKIIADAKKQGVEMNDTIAYNLLGAYQEEVRKWCKIEKKRYDDWHKTTTAKWFFEELERVFGWTISSTKMEV